jgi:hypothetical protein
MEEEISIVSIPVLMPSNQNKNYYYYALWSNIFLGLFIEISKSNIYSTIHRLSTEGKPSGVYTTKDETYTLLHQHWLHTSLNGACYYLL